MIMRHSAVREFTPTLLGPGIARIRPRPRTEGEGRSDRCNLAALHTVTNSSVGSVDRVIDDPIAVSTPVGNGGTPLLFVLGADRRGAFELRIYLD